MIFITLITHTLYIAINFSIPILEVYDYWHKLIKYVKTSDVAQAQFEFHHRIVFDAGNP